MALKYCFFAGVLGMGTPQSFTEVLVESSQEKTADAVVLSPRGNSPIATKILHRALQRGRALAWWQLSFFGYLKMTKETMHGLFGRSPVRFGTPLSIVWLVLLILRLSSIVGAWVGGAKVAIFGNISTLIAALIGCIRVGYYPFGAYLVLGLVLSAVGAAVAFGGTLLQAWACGATGATADASTCLASSAVSLVGLVLLIIYAIFSLIYTYNVLLYPLLWVVFGQ